ncbi:MAG: IS4 family transposase [Chthoniobacterales bacterium]
MNSGRHVLSQIVNFVHWEKLKRLARRYEPNQKIKHFGFRQQFICMVFAQLTRREGLRDIETCFNARPECLYHLGFEKPIARSTLAEANEQRDWRIWQDLGLWLIAKARKLYESEDIGLELDNSIYALDSTTIDLCLKLFPWADFRSTKAGIKMHTQLDLRGSIPSVIDIPAKKADVKWLDDLIFEAGSFYIMDRGYIDFERLFMIAKAQAFFVTRAKDKLRFTRHYSTPTDGSTGIRSDQVGKFTLPKARQDHPIQLRRIRFYDDENKRYFIFLTNNLELPAEIIAKLYKMRWSVELFFKWIKQNLRIKHFYGNSLNAVKTQIWISITTYVIITILHKELKLPGNLHRTLQLLSVHPFGKIAIDQLLTKRGFKNDDRSSCNQLILNGF